MIIAGQGPSGVDPAHFGPIRDRTARERLDIMRFLRRLSIPGMMRAAGCLFGAAATLVVAGCEKPAAQAEPPPPTVGVVNSRRMDVPIIARPHGTTRALQEVSIRARVRGFLTEQHFDEGSYVKKDQLLFVIEEEPYKVALQSAQATLAEAEAALKKAQESKAREIKLAQIGVDEAQLILARLAENRTRNLFSRNAASREDEDKALAERKKFEAQVEADRANYEQAKADYTINILAAQAQVDNAKASVRSAELDLGYCRMYAPIPGRIGEAKIKVGNLVGPASGNNTDTVLASVQQLDPMGVDIQVSSRYLEHCTRLVEQGLAVKLTRPGLDGEQDHPYQGECYFIDNVIDPTTSTFLVKARIANPQRTLLPGDYVKLRLVVDHVDNGIVVPEQAVMETQAGPVVYFVDRGGKVAIQRVEAAQSYEGLRLITKGLEADVPVIVTGLQLVRPGIAVKTEPAVLPQPARDAPNDQSIEPPARSAKAADGAAKPVAAARPAVEPGGPRSAVKAAETSRPASPPPPRDDPKP
jgi:RND family efflux transporter MFP subunit